MAPETVRAGADRASVHRVFCLLGRHRGKLTARQATQMPPVRGSHAYGNRPSVAGPAATFALYNNQNMLGRRSYILPRGMVSTCVSCALPELLAYTVQQASDRSGTMLPVLSTSRHGQLLSVGALRCMVACQIPSSRWRCTPRLRPLTPTVRRAACHL